MSRPDLNDLHRAGADLTRLPHRPAVLDLMPISPEALELAARGGVAALWTPDAMVTACLMRRRLPDAYSVMRAGLRQLRGYAKEVDRWDREVERRTKGKAGVGAELDVAQDGTPRPTLANAVRALRHELERAGDGPRHLTVCALDAFAGVARVDGIKITDTREAQAVIWLDEVHGIRVSSALAGEALRVIAADNTSHPVRDYLDALAWDQKPRAETWMVRLLGVEDTPLHAVYSAAWLVGAVARIMQPGCKLDTVLLLVGAQGLRKSSALRVLAGEWFADTGIDVRDKDARQALSGVWIYEWAELDAVRRSEASAVKAFITAQVDHYRPSYGRNTIDVPRQTVIVGSTNEDDPLSDPSGSRRYWPVRVGAIDLEGLRAERDQLWAEALHHYRSGAQWWLPADYDAERATVAELFATVDPWMVPIVQWARINGPATLARIVQGALGIKEADCHSGHSRRAAALLTSAGAEKGRRGGGGREVVWWFPA